MKIVQIDKNDWEAGLQKLAETYRLFGPVKEDGFHNFKQLDQRQLPDLSCLNTRLSPKSIIYPQTDVMFEYSLDENQEDHHILKEVNKVANGMKKPGPCLVSLNKTQNIL